MRFALYSFSIALLVSVATAQGAVIRVSRQSPSPVPDGQSWSGAFHTVQDGLSAAQPGDEVWVARGVYRELVRVGSGVRLLGGFRGTERRREERRPMVHPTMLVGGGPGPVVDIPETSSDVTLDGFFITNGRWNMGAGVSARGNGATIANNRITDCVAGLDSAPWSPGDGGGIFCTGQSIDVLDNVVVACRAAQWGGGLYYQSQPAGEVRGNTFLLNTAVRAGGGMACQRGSSPNIHHNRFLRNQTLRPSGYVLEGGGGLYLEYAQPHVHNNTFQGNAASVGGGLAAYNSTFRVTNNTFFSNRATISGGGAYVDSENQNVVDAAPVLANNTFVMNAAPSGGAIHTYYGLFRPLRIVNNLIAFNSSGLLGSELTKPDVRSNAIYGNAAYDTRSVTLGSNNLSVNPRLVNPWLGNLHLRKDSPLIEAGDNSVVQPGETDMDDQPRVQADRVDIGADEAITVPRRSRRR